ncbi:MAG: hypothetical protein HY796_11120 [Elusimicrobia bacterium]|nr:hypothetical protein [Elusimicrobiota bacterium]
MLFDGADPNLPAKDFTPDSSNPAALTGGGRLLDLKASEPDLSKVSPVTDFSLDKQPSLEFAKTALLPQKAKAASSPACPEADRMDDRIREYQLTLDYYQKELGVLNSGGGVCKPGSPGYTKITCDATIKLKEELIAKYERWIAEAKVQKDRYLKECAGEEPKPKKPGFWDGVKNHFFPKYTPTIATAEDYERYPDQTALIDNLLAKNQEAAKEMWFPAWFKHVREKGEWSYKDNQEFLDKYFVKDDGEWKAIYAGRVITAADLGNINYGLTGREMGIPYWLLGFGAGTVDIFQSWGASLYTNSIFNYFDDKDDSYWIKYGYKLDYPP